MPCAQESGQFKYPEDNQAKPKIDQRPHVHSKALVAGSGREIGRESEIESVPKQDNDEPPD